MLGKKQPTTAVSKVLFSPYSSLHFSFDRFHASIRTSASHNQMMRLNASVILALLEGSAIELTINSRKVGDTQHQHILCQKGMVMQYGVQHS